VGYGKVRKFNDANGVEVTTGGWPFSVPDNGVDPDYFMQTVWQMPNGDLIIAGSDNTSGKLNRLILVDGSDGTTTVDRTFDNTFVGTPNPTGIWVLRNPSVGGIMILPNGNIIVMLEDDGGTVRDWTFIMLDGTDLTKVATAGVWPKFQLQVEESGTVSDMVPNNVVGPDSTLYMMYIGTDFGTHWAEVNLAGTITLHDVNTTSSGAPGGQSHYSDGKIVVCSQTSDGAYYIYDPASTPNPMDETIINWTPVVGEDMAFVSFNGSVSRSTLVKNGVGFFPNRVGGDTDKVGIDARDLVDGTRVWERAWDDIAGHTTANHPSHIGFAADGNLIVYSKGTPPSTGYDVLKLNIATGATIWNITLADDLVTNSHRNLATLGEVTDFS
jgi:hypothetical protein